MNSSTFTTTLALILLSAYYHNFVKPNSQEDKVKNILFLFNDIIINGVYNGNQKSSEVTTKIIVDKQFEDNSRK